MNSAPRLFVVPVVHEIPPAQLHARVEALAACPSTRRSPAASAPSRG